MRFLNDICKTAITTLGSEGWKNPPPLPVKPPPETLSTEETMGMAIGIPLLGIPFIFIVALLGSVYFCRDMVYHPEEKNTSAALEPCHEEKQDDELADVEIALTAANLVQVTAKATKNLLPGFGPSGNGNDQREKKLKRSPLKRLKKKIRRKRYLRQGDLATPLDVEEESNVDHSPRRPPRTSLRVQADQG